MCEKFYKPIRTRDDLAEFLYELDSCNEFMNVYDVFGLTDNEKEKLHILRLMINTLAHDLDSEYEEEF